MTLVAHKFKIVKKLQNETFVNISVVSHKKDEVIHTLTTTDGFIIPICQGTAEYKSGLRKAFITPGKDWYFITADYGQEELRLAGIFSGEKNIIEPIQQGKDIHTYVAQKMFGFSDKHHRTRVKTLNFGVLYGCTKYTVARKLNISPEEGQQLLDRYYKTMKKLEAWIDYMHKLGRRTGMVFTYFGRPRLVGKYYNSSDPHKWAFADRTCVNSVCQGPVTGDTEVLTDKGYQRIERLTGSELCWTGSDWQSFKVVDQGEQECYEMITTDGNRIRFSEEHRFKIATVKDYEWLDRVPKVGDKLCKILPIELDSNGIDIEKFYWIGYLMGDGVIYDNNIAICCSKKELKPLYERATKYWSNLGYHMQPPYRTNGSKGETWQFRVSCKKWVEALNDLGYIKGRAKTKRIYSGVFAASFKEKKAFVQGFFDSDGSKKRIVWHLCQRPLLEDTKLLLETLGVRSRIYNQNDGTFVLQVNARDWRVLQGGKDKGNISSEEVSVVPEVVRNKIAEYKGGGKWRWLKYKAHTGQTISPRYVKKMNNECNLGITELYETVGVKTIVPIGKHQVYCLSLQDSKHQFITRGLVSHNCVPINQYIETEDGVIMYNKVLGKRLYQTYGKKHSFIYRILRFFNL